MDQRMGEWNNDKYYIASFIIFDYISIFQILPNFNLF